MNLYYYIIFTFFALVSYMMIVDKNIITFIELMVQFSGVQLKRAWFIIRFHPANPIPRWTFARRIERMTRELEKDLQMDTKHLTDDE